MLTLDSLTALVGADSHPARPDGALQGECPVCGRRRYLDVLPFEDGTALVRCMAGCASREILAGLRVDVADVRLVEDSAPGFEVRHALSLDDTDPFGAGLLSRSDLDALPGPEPLIAGTLDLRTLAVLAGAPGSGKSLTALDWSASIATGTPWLGRETREGRVLYLAGEGAHGLSARLRAWEVDRLAGSRIADDRLRVAREAVQVTDSGALDALVTHVERERYSLVVVDTLARATVGVDENSAEGMGRVVEAVDRIRRATGDGTVLLVHHTGKSGAVRGSSVLEGATDTLYLAIPSGAGESGGGLRLTRSKRKDGPREDASTWALRTVPLDGTGETSSVVLEPLDGPRSGPEIGDARERAWTAFRRTFGDLSASRAEFVRVLTGPDWDVPRSTAYRAVAFLESVGALALVSDEGDPKKYRARPSFARVHGLPDVKALDGLLDAPAGPSLTEANPD